LKRARISHIADAFSRDLTQRSKQLGQKEPHPNEIVVREFCCPGCARLFAVEVRKKDAPVLYDTDLR